MNTFKMLVITASMGMYSNGMAATNVKGTIFFNSQIADKNVSVSGWNKNYSKMDTLKSNQTIINLGGHQVPVLKGGLYDRFRSNPPLSVVEKEAPEIDLSWFETIQKQKKEVGFTTYSPNFYYSNSSITAIYTADMKMLKKAHPSRSS